MTQFHVCSAPYHAVMIGLYADFHVCAIVKRHEEVPLTC